MHLLDPRKDKIEITHIILNEAQAIRLFLSNLIFSGWFQQHAQSV